MEANMEKNKKKKKRKINTESVLMYQIDNLLKN